MDTQTIDISEIITWPQAVVAIFVLLSITVFPQIVTLIQNNNLKKAQEATQSQFRNNGGSTMKDAVDRIENTLTEHVTASAARAVEMDARLAELESVKGRHV